MNTLPGRNYRRRYALWQQLAHEHASRAQLQAEYAGWGMVLSRRSGTRRGRHPQLKSNVGSQQQHSCPAICLRSRLSHRGLCPPQEAPPPSRLSSASTAHLHPHTVVRIQFYDWLV
jgi:hypothetical protein